MTGDYNDLIRTKFLRIDGADNSLIARYNARLVDTPHSIVAQTQSETLSIVRLHWAAASNLSAHRADLDYCCRNRSCDFGRRWLRSYRR